MSELYGFPPDERERTLPHQHEETGKEEQSGHFHLLDDLLNLVDARQHLNDAKINIAAAP